MAKKSSSTDKKKDKVEVQVADPRHFFCNRAFFNVSEEEFLIAFQTGGVVECQYIFTPKHAKRFYLRLKEKIEEYEKKYGELDTSLPS